MKKIKLVIAALAFSAFSGFAQQPTNSVPQGIKYQAVVRNANGDGIGNQNVSFRISLLLGSETGAIAYQETQQATTNQLGLVNLTIGRGNVAVGPFDSVKWGSGPIFVKIEVDPSGGSNYTLMSTSEMLSVPYALYAAKSGSLDNFPVKAALQATNSAAPLTNPETGMLVYNTDSAGVAPFNVTPGYYYNAGTPQEPKWIALSTENKSTDKLLPPCASSNEFGSCSGNGTLTGIDNTGHGDAALENVTSGSSNVADGAAALIETTSGSNNVAVGPAALFENETGSNNVVVGGYAGPQLIGGSTSTNSITAVGYYTLQSNSDDYTTAIGYNALNENKSGDGNVAVGANVLYQNDANRNTGVGFDALYSEVAQSDNVAIGYKSLYSLSYTSSYSTYNTALGNYSLYSDLPTATTNGYQNTGLGYSTLYSNTTGLSNTASGMYALYTNSTASGNNADGFSALYSNIDGDYNTASGDSALAANNHANYNTATGYQAMANNTYGNYNVAVGYQALLKQSYGTSVWNAQNTAIGAFALYTNQPTSTANGSHNTGCGYEALYFNTYGNENTALGMQAGICNTTGVSNTLIGVGSAYENQSGSYNTVVGHYALFGVSTNSSSYNTTVGEEAMYDNTTGSYNTSLGYSSLSLNKTGTYNTCIGYDANIVSPGSLTDATAIGSNAVVNASDQMRFGDGNVTGWGFGMNVSGIGSGCYGTNTVVIAVNTNGGVYMDNTGAWHLCSDRNKKTHFEAVDGDELLKKLNQLPITNWRYKVDTATNHIGPMAQDFYKLFQVGNDSLSISTVDEPGVALACVQALNKKLEKENSELKAQLNQQQDAQVKEEKEIAELRSAVNSLMKEQASIK
jgi:hypothetical protein